VNGVEKTLVCIMFFCFFSLIREYVFFENLLFPSSDSVQPFADEVNVAI